MTTPLTLTADRSPDGTPVLVAAGEIDMSNVEAFATALAADPGGPLVVDLTEVQYLDSAGVTALFAHARRIELLVTPLLAPVLTISGLTELATVRGIEG
ncbi:STAS domain-containing protein [Streptomyces sp. NPDC058674]|uniref:STAS domain-containing protein n=1 Tax=Streptomyces sp. NPDC058674 TaxID=3346592 RepID=UPI003667F8D7